MGVIMKNGTMYGAGLSLEMYDAIKHISNPNLLINPDFKINTKGQNVYTSNIGRFETVNKWFAQKNIDVTLTDEGLTISNSIGSTHDMTGFGQDITDVSKYHGKTLTMTICAKGSGIVTLFPIEIDKSGSTEVQLSNEFKVYKLTGTVADDAVKIQSGVCLRNEEESEITIKYIKLEEGTTGTSFTPPDTLVETAKCMGIDNLLKAEKSTITNIVKPALNTVTKNGITCTNNEDGTFTLNGIAEEYTTFTICNLSVTENKTFRILGAPYGESDIGYFLGGLNIDYVPYVGKECTFNPDTTYQLDIAVKQGVTCENVIFKPMVTTNVNATYDDFVSYTGDSGKLNTDVAELVKKLS